MLRTLVMITAVVCALQVADAPAQGRSGKNHRHGGAWFKARRSSGPSYTLQQQGRYSRPGSLQAYPSSSFGISIGVGSYPGYGYGYSSFGYLDPYRFDGFGYDPYRYGTFQAPDLLDDPYYIQRHRYDSHFPGRRGARLELRSSVGK